MNRPPFWAPLEERIAWHRRWLKQAESLQQDIDQHLHGADLTAGWTAAPAAQFTGYHISLERPQCSILSE